LSSLAFSVLHLAYWDAAKLNSKPLHLPRIIQHLSLSLHELWLSPLPIAPTYGWLLPPACAAACLLLLLLLCQRCYPRYAFLTHLLLDTLPSVGFACTSVVVVGMQYPDAAEFENDIEALGGQVDHGVDATQLHKCESLVEAGPWDCVIFNFPHVGFGIKDQLKNIRANQEMLRDFLASATTMLHGTGEIHITIKRGEPYESWKVVKLGTETAGLKLKNAFDFVPAQYPKYRHRRTLGFAEGISTKQNEDIIAGAKTYVFVKASAQPGPSGDTGKPGKKRKGPPEKEKGGEQGNGKKRSGKKERRSDQNRSRNH
jgi:25S rRNA (uracil2634-N3)-methyltransferase